MRSHGIFGKLLAIMLTMAISLLLLVTVFFAYVMVPALNRSIDAFVDDYTRKLAATQPDLATAQQMSRRLDLDIRYEGPGGTWSTSPWLPPISQVQPRAGRWMLGGSGYHIAPAPNGGTYLFHWSFRRHTVGAHQVLFSGLLLLIVAAVVAAHMVIRRMLRPLRTLGDGVARLSAGELDVVLPAPGRDEFGVLTNAFNEMVGRVRAMIAARDQLLLDVSHELRSPLTRMRVAVELLPEGKDRAHMTADIVEMEAMIAELLELERLRDGRGIRTAPQNLGPLVREVVAGFAEKPPGMRVVSLPAEMPVDVDAEKIRIVLRNLLDNAIKYSLPDSAPVEVSAACDDERVVLRVSDDGPGIPEADRATIFEPFFRVNRSRAKTPPGYGLGLSICKRIVEAHGGSIALVGGRGRGTTFEITLRRR